MEDLGYVESSEISRIAYSNIFIKHMDFIRFFMPNFFHKKKKLFYQTTKSAHTLIWYKVSGN